MDGVCSNSRMDNDEVDFKHCVLSYPYTNWDNNKIAWGGFFRFKKIKC